MNAYFILDELVSGMSSASYIVLDDISLSSCSISLWKGLLGAQKQFVATDKYRKKTVVKFGKPCIFLCNPDSDPWRDNKLTVDFLDWLNLNCIKVDLEHPLYLQ